MKSKVATCLWFENDAETAAAFYTTLIDGSQVGSVMRNPDGSALIVELTLAGVPYQLLNGGPRYQLNESVSVVVHTDDQAETDRLWAALTADGGSESMCGWCKDRFGVSWQIVPRPMLRLFGDDDREAAGRAMQAMLKMQKIDIAALEAAFADKAKGENHGVD